MIEDKTNIRHKRDLSKIRNTKAIHHPISYIFDQLLANFDKILMFIFIFLLPETDSSVTNIFGNLSTTQQKRIISIELGRCTSHSNSILKKHLT